MTKIDEEFASITMEFLDDSQEQFDECEKYMMSYEKDQDTGNLKELKRIIHTLKGEAHSVNLKKTGDLFHDFETVVETKQVSDASDFAHFVLKFVDMMRDYFRAISDGEDVDRIEKSFDTYLK
ncbi:Hpt domain-containing protein [Bacteriovoracaceae bacterium]|nr:Hpt domain-containing protein [Bacteriovoracaceae bacterium]